MKKILLKLVGLQDSVGNIYVVLLCSIAEFKKKIISQLISLIVYFRTWSVTLLFKGVCILNIFDSCLL